MSPPKILTDREERAAFYYFLGLTITQWAEIEQELFRIASLSYPKSARKQFATTFFSIENFRSKLQVADRLVRQSKAGVKHLKRWEEVAFEVEKASTKRNALAHHVIQHYRSLPGRRIALVGRFTEPSKFKQAVPKAPSGSICLAELVDIRHRFFGISLNLLLLYCKLARHKAPLPISRAQEVGVLNLAELTRLIRRELPLQQEPYDE